MPDCAGTKSPSCPRTILDLIERFELHRETYQRETYNETQVRREFIDPFFKSLGWDVDNESGHAEAYKDVIHEDAIKVGGSTKAPDYCFRIGGSRKFFVEAKKPSVSVGDDPGPAYQLRRYAWTNKLPLSIVTDFEEFAVYDCRIKPRPDDKPSTARVLYLKCDEYPKRWDEIASIFSQDAILKGSFDKYAESNKRKRGTAEVDDEFLKEIESWRDELARSIALRNPNLTVRDLNYAVGKTIDRLIFLRMCEDRGVETYAQLRLLLNGPRVYPRLLEIFYKADQRYNSGLFHFEPEKNRPEPPDNLTPNLTIDDAVLKSILKNLYYPQCPYEFSVMPPEILGQVYEQFLGKVITLTAGHRAKVEYKPEVKKAGGVYYTPKYIVDYIVEHTVGKLLEGKTPADVGPMLDQRRARKEADNQSGERKRPDCLRILDPACGSGSFLLGAYQRLLDWHLKWYSEHDPEKWAKKKTPPIYQVATVQYRDRHGADSGGRGSCRAGDPVPARDGAGNYRLTITEKKRILLNNIYGVDIDPQAVEVTKLSLLLKVLEGESQQTLDNQLHLFHERALPDLGGNIKCGNSLICPDFYDNQQLELLDDEERYRINVFDWHAEFPEVFPSPHGRGQGEGTGGFDAVIGNPPYLSYSGRQAIDISDDERRYYETRYSSGGWPTSHGLFIERAIRDLASRVVAYIVPDQVGHLDGYRVVRDVIAARSSLVEVRYWGERVFNGVVTPALTFVADKSSSGPATLYLTNGSALELLNGKSVKWTASRNDGMIGRIQRIGRSLGRMVADPGIHTGNCSKQLILPQSSSQDSSVVAVLEGKQISRYHCAPPAKGLNLQYRPQKGEYFTIRAEARYTSAPFVIRQTAAYPIVGPRKRAGYFRNSLLALYPPPDPLDIRFFVGLLNSRLIRFVYCATVQESQQRAFPQVKIRTLRQLPMYWPEIENTKDRLQHDRLVELVQRMLDLYKELSAARTPTDKTSVQRQIEGTDRQIDRLVYALYRLTEDDIAKIEASFSKNEGDADGS